MKVPSHLEVSLIKKYLISRGLDYEHFLNKLYPQSCPENPDTAIGNHMLNIWDIIKAFETTIGRETKKLNGVFYTPYFIVDYINSRVIYENSNKEIKVIDPACGSGIFLIDALFKLKQKLKKSYKELVEENIFGVDIDPEAIGRTKVLLSLVVFENENKIPENFNLYSGNSLDKEFLKETFNGGRFEAVVGNPPYIRIQNLEEETRKIIKKHWKLVQGDTDIFIPFIELGIDLLKDGGKMGYITPNSYFTTHSAKSLREFLQHNKYIEEIVDFGDYQVFEGVTTYTAITIISKKAKDYFIFSRVKDKEELKSLKGSKSEKIYYKKLNPKKWVLVSSRERELIDMIEGSAFKLKDVADIRVGLATLADKVYVIDEAKEKGDYFLKFFEGEKFLIEKEITKEIIKASVIKSEEDIWHNRRRIIFPYKETGSGYVVIDEAELKEKFPGAYNYLLSCKEILLNRDKGKRKYETWYAYGRSQGINTTFGRKILTPPMALNPTFVVCEKEKATFYSGYGIFPKIEPFKDLYLTRKSFRILFNAVPRWMWPLE